MKKNNVKPKNVNSSIAENRKAFHDYFLFDKYEAGISLLGCEVKSIRERRINLKDSFVRVMRDEAYLMNCHISTYSKIQGYEDIDPIRTRKLLLKRSEINALMGAATIKGNAIVPTKLYFRRGFVKVEIAVAKGKKQYDKRETLKRRIHNRESQIAMKKASQGRIK